MKAYSYLRYSTPEQARGDSLRRQLEASRRYADEHSLDLDESLKPDCGVSAFHGKNRTQGNLGAFLADIKSGKVERGSVLLVESLDRLSREEVEEAMYQFLDIIRAGIEIHTLADRPPQIFKKGQLKTEQLMLSLFVMSRANEESLRKSERVAAAWSAKKRNATPGQAITCTVPAWLHATKGAPIVVIPERKKIVKQIFKMSASGMGKRLIARRLNEQGVASWGKDNGWRDSYVRKILFSRSTLGEYQPHRETATGRVPDGEPVPDYYPAVISQAEWLAVHSNGAPKPKAGRVGRMSNLFSGLILDADLKLPMIYQDKRGRSRPKLVTDSIRFGIKPHRIDYQNFEYAFLHFLDQLDWATVLDVSDSSEVTEAENQAARTRLEIVSLKEKRGKIINYLLNTNSPGLTEELQKSEADIQEKELAHKQHQARLQTLRQKHSDLLDTSVVFTKLAKAKDFETRARLRQEIRRKVEAIYFFQEKKRPDYINFCIRFVNGVTRLVCFNETKGGVILTDVGNSPTEKQILKETAKAVRALEALFAKRDQTLAKRGQTL